MLTDVELPAILGTSAPQANAADLQTKGWEAALTWRDKIGQDLNYRLTLSLSDWRLRSPNTTTQREHCRSIT
ncbi:MAG: hypothetical protein R2824_02645 [Saprospiraceae bacterium]